jgi:hypothetical protein
VPLPISPEKECPIPNQRRYNRNHNYPHGILIAEGYLQPYPIIYLIRHGEKPSKDAEGKDSDGLSAEGIKRAQAFVKTFGPDSEYNIKYILAQHPKKG